MKKHAYLIMAHNQPEVLKKLLLLLDHDQNDLYIHIDKKMKNFKKNEFESLLKKSECCFVTRTNVKWGDYSQINCELLLLKEATKKEHSYYHLLSGVDFPLKKQDEIHDFFEKYKGLEFVDEDFPIIEDTALDRIKYYYFLTDKKTNFAYSLKRKILKAQKVLKINRLNSHSDIIFQKGRNWFSITHELAKELIKQESLIKKIFKYSHCGDELFLQTIARNTAFYEKICNKNTMPEISDTRYIDWRRGNPYVFRNEDYCELKNSDALFARKFDERVDNDIIEKLYKDLLMETKEAI